MKSLSSAIASPQLSLLASVIIIGLASLAGISGEMSVAIILQSDHSRDRKCSVCLIASTSTYPNSAKSIAVILPALVTENAILEILLVFVSTAVPIAVQGNIVLVTPVESYTNVLLKLLQNSLNSQQNSLDVIPFRCGNSK